MKNIKKTFVMVVSLVLVAALAIGGTVAYLTVDPVEKSNIFTVGDIAIQLNEEVAVHGAGTVEENENGATYTGVMPGDYLKKEVSVTNTGKNPAYVAVEVTFNNANLINAAIDEVYENKDYSNAQIQAIYDYIFDGFGINYNPRPGAAGINDARGVIDGTYGLPEHALKVDFAKTIDGSTVIGATNWFVAGKEKAGQYWVDGPLTEYDGYYTADMENYQIRYTYYLHLEADEESVLFKGFNVPASFNAAQLEMFENMQIDIVATAIQADNFADAKSAFTALKAEYEDGVNDGDQGAPTRWEVDNAAELETALATGGIVTLTANIAVDEAMIIPEGITVFLDLGDNTISAASGYGIENKGNLTIDGEGTISGLGAIRSTAGKLTINSGNYLCSSKWQDGVYQHTLKAENTEVVINGGTFDATVNGQSNAMFNASAGSIITINGGTFKNVAGELSKFDPYLFTYEKDGKVVINDGDFYGGWRFNGDTATTDIYGGTFNLSTDGQSFNATSTHKLSIYGGTFAFGIADTQTSVLGCIAEGYEVIENANGTYTVQLDVAVGTEIKDALNDSTTTTVVAGENIDLSKAEYQSGGENTLTIKDGKTLDLNDNNISRPSNGSGNGVAIPGNATVTIKNGSITNESDNTGVDISSGATATFEDIDFIGKGDDMIRLRANTNAKTTIIFKGCTFTNAGVLLGGMNGACEVDIQFIDCTFTGTYKMYDEEGNALTDPYGHIHYTSSLINAERSGSYLCGNISFDNCKFDFDASESSYKRNVLEFKGPSTSYGKTMTVTLKDVTINGKNIVPVKVATTYASNITIVEEGENAYTNNGVVVNYDGSAK